MGEMVTQSSLVMASVLFTVLMAGAVAALIPLWRAANLALVAIRRLALHLSPRPLPPELARHLDAAGEFVLTRRPLRGDLDAPRRALANQLRLLLRSLEPALTDPALHIDARVGLMRYGHDASDTSPSLALSGDLWRWLSSAEQILASDQGGDELLDAIARAVRQQLLADGPFLPRLAQMLDLLVRYDDAMRQPPSGGYRSSATDPLAPSASLGFAGPHPAARPNAEEDADAQTVLARHDRAIRSVAKRYADDFAAREDLGQEIRLSVWRALPAYRGEGSLRSYVLRIAHLCGARFARRQWRHLELTATTGPADPSADPELEFSRRALSSAVEGLPAAQREPLALQLAGHSYKEIGDALGLTESNVSARISRARARLKRSLAAD